MPKEMGKDVNVQKDAAIKQGNAAKFSQQMMEDSTKDFYAI